MSDGNRQWVITAYTLAFGGLPPPAAGRPRGSLSLSPPPLSLSLSSLSRPTHLHDRPVGLRRRVRAGGAAANSGMLFGARALQGVFAALLAPAALSLLTTTFTDPAERGKAFGVFGAIVGAGAGVRAARRRLPHPVPGLALVPVRQRAHRPGRVRRRPGRC